MKLGTRRWAPLVAALSCSVAFAQAPAKPDAAKPEASKTDSAKTMGAAESQVAARFAERSGMKPDQVFRSKGGLFEVLTSGEIFYVDANVDFVISGRMFDSRTREDLTQKRLDVALKVDVKSLPLDRAVKTVRGDGSRVLVTFEDPNCGYCKKLWQNMATLNNVTIYTFLYPILSADSMDKSKAIWCSKDRALAWDNHMLNGKTAAAPAGECKDPLEQNLAFGKNLGISGTPTLIFADGTRSAGAMPVASIEQRLATAKR